MFFFSFSFFFVKDRHLLKLSGYCKSVRHFSPTKRAAGKGTLLQLHQVCVCVCVDGFLKTRAKNGSHSPDTVKSRVALVLPQGLPCAVRNPESSKATRYKEV